MLSVFADSFSDYVERTRHPWTCLLFVVPLVIAYEVGLRWLSLAPDELRTGADAWLARMAASLGIAAPFAAPALLFAGLFGWGLMVPRTRSDPVAALVGILAESALFAGLLFGIVQFTYPLLAHWGEWLNEPMSRILEASSASTSSPEQTWEMIVRYTGAGIYEEAIFRLAGFTLVRVALGACGLGDPWASLTAAVASSVGFAAAHHWAGGEAFVGVIFLYRFLAGLFFAALFRVRGFGIAVGAHSGYDVLVGLILR